MATGNQTERDGGEDRGTKRKKEKRKRRGDGNTEGQLEKGGRKKGRVERKRKKKSRLKKVKKKKCAGSGLGGGEEDGEERS